jgi:branched-chain amino acid transport system ATP-binding protein
VTAAIEVEALSRRYGALRAVDEVTLTVEAGTRHALIGSNGAGKTTLFRLISGNLRPTSGVVRLAGQDVTTLAEHRRARRGLVQTFQHSALFPRLCVRDNVVLAAQARAGRAASLVPRRRPALVAVAGELLDRVGLAGRGDTAVGALSHGERRQLEVAVALACEPTVLMLDEPTAGMSPAESRRFAELIEDLPPDLTVLVIEHDLDVVFRLASTVTVLHLGRVLASGGPGAVKADAAVQEAYFGAGVQGDVFAESSRRDEVPG